MPNWKRIKPTNKVMQKVTPCLWFNQEAEEAVTLDTSIFPRSKSWQIVPTIPGKWLRDGDVARSERVIHTMLQMTKLDIGNLRPMMFGETCRVAAIPGWIFKHNRRNQ